MAVDDLRAIPGLLAGHQLVLATRLRIATFQALALADPKAIFVAMSRLRPQPTLDEIMEWQDRARWMHDEGGKESPTWERAATFVLSFEHRRVGDRMERRLMAEQTELEPEQPPSSWAGWGCDKLTDWLRRRTGAVTQPEPEATEALQAAVEPTPARHPLHFERVEVVDASGRVEIVGAGRPAGMAVECSIPCWLEVLVGGETPRQQVQLAVRLRRDGGPTWSLGPPTTAPHNGPACLDLVDAAPGHYHARLVAWTPDASAEPVAAELGPLTILPPPGQTSH